VKQNYSIFLNVPTFLHDAKRHHTCAARSLSAFSGVSFSIHENSHIFAKFIQICSKSMFIGENFVSAVADGLSTRSRGAVKLSCRSQHLKTSVLIASCVNFLSRPDAPATDSRLSN